MRVTAPRPRRDPAVPVLIARPRPRSLPAELSVRPPDPAPTINVRRTQGCRRNRPPLSFLTSLQPHRAASCSSLSFCHSETEPRLFLPPPLPSLPQPDAASCDLCRAWDRPSLSTTSRAHGHAGHGPRTRRDLPGTKTVRTRPSTRRQWLACSRDPTDQTTVQCESASDECLSQSGLLA